MHTHTHTHLFSDTNTPTTLSTASAPSYPRPCWPSVQLFLCEFRKIKNELETILCFMLCFLMSRPISSTHLCLGNLLYMPYTYIYIYISHTHISLPHDLPHFWTDSFIWNIYAALIVLAPSRFLLNWFGHYLLVLCDFSISVFYANASNEFQPKLCATFY